MRQHVSEIGLEFRKSADKHWARMVLFGTLLIVSHLLTIKPSEIDAEGIKIGIGDVSVIRGGLALLFLYYVFMSLSLFVQGAMLLPLSIERNMARRFLRIASKPEFGKTAGKRVRPTPKEAKQAARLYWIIYLTVMTPFYIVIFAIVAYGLPLAAYDSYQFGSYATVQLLATHDSDLENQLNAADANANALERQVPIANSPKPKVQHRAPRR
jgi:hypothetical protein